MMESTEFAEIAPRILGPNWARKISQSFNLNIRTVQRMATGERRIPFAIQEFIRFHEAAK